MNQTDRSAYEYLSVAADMVVINVLCVICCLPVVTIGASVAAAHKVMQDLAMGREGSGIKEFFSALRDNFLQASLAFWGFAAVLISLICQGLLIRTLCSGILELALLGLLMGMGILMLAIETHVRSLMVRYRNSIREHIHNALLLVVTRPMRSCAAVVLRLLPVVLWLAEPDLFWRTSILWPLIGICGISMLESLLMKAVFEELEMQATMSNLNQIEGE